MFSSQQALLEWKSFKKMIWLELDTWSSHPVNPIPDLVSLCSYINCHSSKRAFHWILEHGSRDLCSFSHNSSSEVRCWCWVRRPGVYSWCSSSSLCAQGHHAETGLSFLVPGIWNYNATAYRDILYNCVLFYFVATVLSGNPMILESIIQELATTVRKLK